MPEEGHKVKHYLIPIMLTTFDELGDVNESNNTVTNFFASRHPIYR